MNLTMPITDNITELLVKIMQFTKMRHHVLTRNITEFNNDGFEPMDLQDEQFAELLNDAIDEHRRSKRLLLRDTTNFKFGTNGFFNAEPIVDKQAKEFFETDMEEYVAMQNRKLSENSLNYHIAVELLKFKDDLVPVTNN